MMAIPNFTDWFVSANSNGKEPATETEAGAQTEFAALLSASYVAPPIAAPISVSAVTPEVPTAEAQLLVVPLSLAPAVLTAAAEITSAKVEITADQKDAALAQETRHKAVFVSPETIRNNESEIALGPQPLPALTKVLRSDRNVAAETSTPPLPKGNLAPVELPHLESGDITVSSGALAKSAFSPPAPMATVPLGNSDPGNHVASEGQRESVKASNEVSEVQLLHRPEPDQQHIRLTESRLATVRNAVSAQLSDLPATTVAPSPTARRINFISPNETTERSTFPAATITSATQPVSFSAPASTQASVSHKELPISSAPLAKSDVSAEPELHSKDINQALTPTAGAKAERHPFASGHTTIHVHKPGFISLTGADSEWQNVPEPPTVTAFIKTPPVTESVRLAAAVVKTIVVETTGKNTEPEATLNTATLTVATTKTAPSAPLIAAPIVVAATPAASEPASPAAPVDAPIDTPFVAPVDVPIDAPIDAAVKPSPLTPKAPMLSVSLPTKAGEPALQAQAPVLEAVEITTQAHVAASSPVTLATATSPPSPNPLHTTAQPTEIAAQFVAAPLVRAERELVPEGFTEIPAAPEAEDGMLLSVPASTSLPLPLRASAETPTPVAQTMESVLTLAQSVPLSATRTLRLSLHPVELGHVAVEVTRADDGRISATLTVEQAETAQTLSHGIGQLRESLERAGVTVEQLHVTTTPSFQPQTTQHFGQQAGHNTNQPDTATTAFTNANAASADSTGAEDSTPVTAHKLLSVHA
ncbi:MAG TPA: flagellar hook-length control protein FliK [Blastocatellia bacterium]|nr:flagellar hook-length control protein FliK [Blastocatellia bacterium]